VTHYAVEKLNSLSKEFDLFEGSFDNRAMLLEQSLYPPLPVANNFLVWGFPLVAAAVRSGKSRLNCIELETDDKTELLSTALRLENRPGGYSLLEQSHLYSFMEKSGILNRVEEILSHVEQVNLRVNPRVIPRDHAAKWLLEMKEYASFPDSLQRLVREKLIDFKTAIRIKTLPGSFFHQLYLVKERFSFSERRLLLHFFREIVGRDGLSVPRQEEFGSEILRREDALAFVQSLRYPELTALFARFAALTDSLKNKGIIVTPPPQFEGGTFDFSFSCTSRAVYAKRIAALKDFEDQIDRLYELL
jgi:hypothetical protein